MAETLSAGPFDPGAFALCADCFRRHAAFGWYRRGNVDRFRGTSIRPVVQIGRCTHDALDIGGLSTPKQFNRHGA